jgi:formyl-CoA transferase
MSITGEEGGLPMRSGPNVGDTGVGLHCSIGILAALHQRSQTGLGQLVSTTMQDAVINLSRASFVYQFLHGEPMPRTGNVYAEVFATSPDNAYPCKPGGLNDYCVIYTSRAGNDQWERLLKLMEREDLLGEERFNSPKQRYLNRAEVDRIVGAWTVQFTKFELMQLLSDANIPAGAVMSTADLSVDEDLYRRGTFGWVDHPKRGRMWMPGPAIQLSESKVPLQPAPLLGQHTDEVYREVLSLSDDEISELRSVGAI